MVVGERVSGERPILLLHPQHRPSISGIGYKPAEAEDGQTLISKGPVTQPCNTRVCVCVCSFILLTSLTHQREPHRLLLQKRPLSAPSSAGKHSGLPPHGKEQLDKMVSITPFLVESIKSKFGC